jgi:hypothetical protein
MFGCGSGTQGDARDDAPGSSALTAYLSSEQAGSADLLPVRVRELGLPYPRGRCTRVAQGAAGRPGATIILLAFYQAHPRHGQPRHARVAGAANCK